MAAAIHPSPPFNSRMRAFLHAVGLWIVTGLDDIFVERFRTRLRRGEVGAAFRTFPDVVLGYSGCAVLLVLAVAAVVALTAALR